MRWSAMVCAGALVATGCAPAGGQVFHSAAGDFVVQTAAKGLDHPWALGFLPDRRLLVTERPGRVRLIARDGTLSPALAGVPKVFAAGQGGLHDLVLDRGFAQNQTIYFCYAEPTDGGARTALARAHPVTGKLWDHEHGPRGGDEVNIIEKGKNYGWPVIGYGIDYSGARIHESTHKAGMEQPLKYWVPSIAPSGMTFYSGDLFASWRGGLFLGALAGQVLVRLELDGEKVVNEERLLQQLRERIRDVREGPDGALWLATDSSSGRILRLVPAK